MNSLFEVNGRRSPVTGKYKNNEGRAPGNRQPVTGNSITYWFFPYKLPFFVLRNFSNGISSCLMNPFCGNSLLATISTTAATEAAVVQEMARHSLPFIVIG